MKKLILLFSLLCSVAFAETSPNLINNNTWSGVGAYAPDPDNCCSNPAGSQPLYDTNTNTIKFSYGQATVHQAWAINQALSGSGVQIGGYNWSYSLRNLNGSGGQNGTDTLTSYSYMTDSAGNVILSNSLTHNTQFDWTNFNGTQTLSSPYDLANAGTVGIQFTGSDGGFWAGLYGPEIKDVSLSLNYTVDPCVSNPRYSSSCPGYNDVWSSNNLVNIYGNSFAVNQALGFGNTGVQVHSAIVGFDYNINGQYCSGGWALGICLGWSNSKVRGQWNVLDPNNNIITYDDKTISTQHTSGTYRNEVLIGRDISTIGNSSITLSKTGNATASDPYIEFTFRPDICQSDPLVNPSCPGYAEAYFSLQCVSNPLYDSTCPGYSAAYLSQQCSINTLYDTSCPGYAVAYFNYQCSVNPLYATQCPGYDQAYFDQQCSLDPLYDNACSGYAAAYYDLQCSNNPLYDSGCTGYTAAYYDLQCSNNPLYDSGCTGYAAAYLAQQCSINTLYDTSCPGYAAAYFNQQCSIDGLYDQQCPNYAEAYAKNNLVSTQSSVTLPISSEPSITISSDGTVSTDVKLVGDEDVNKVITSTATSTAPSPTATVSLTPSGGSNANTKTDSAQNEKKTQTASAPVQTSKRKRAAIAQKQSQEQARESLKEAANATTMEDQVAVQNVVLQAMGFVPGFSSYQNSVVVDTLGKELKKQYNKPVVDNARAQRALSGASDRRHQQMVDDQYSLTAIGR